MIFLLYETRNRGGPQMGELCACGPTPTQTLVRGFAANRI